MPLSLDDVLLGEWLWAASKSLLSGWPSCWWWLLGLAHGWAVLWIVPLTG